MLLLTTMQSVPSYYFILRISNDGRGRAEKVEVQLADIQKKNPSGDFVSQPNVPWMNLKWSHTGTTVVEGISPGMKRDCDLGFVREPQNNTATDFELETEVKPLSGDHILKTGVYRVHLKVAAGNAQPTVTIVEINHTGQWFAPLNQMTSNGIGVKVV